MGVGHPVLGDRHLALGTSIRDQGEIGVSMHIDEAWRDTQTRHIDDLRALAVIKLADGSDLAIFYRDIAVIGGQAGAAHVVRIVGLCSQSQPFARSTECSTCVAMHQLQHATVSVQAVIQSGNRTSAGSVDYGLLGVFVQTLCEN